MDRKSQGNTGEAFAIFYYTSKGYVVSKPLCENTPYDLMVDDRQGKLFRVQVKSSGYQRYPGGGFTVQLRTNGGNMSGHGRFKFISHEDVDKVFVLCLDGSFYEIPAEDIEGKANIILSSTSSYYIGQTVL